MQDSKNPETILSVERAMVILKRLSDSKKGIGVRDLSRELGYSPSVTQKTLNTLKCHDFVQQDTGTGRYTLGFGTVRIGIAMLDRLDVVRIAQPYMEELTSETRETTFLAIRDGLNAVYINKVTSPNAIRMDAEIGSNRPLNCTAVGKVHLAWGPASLIDEMVQENAFGKQTENSIVDAELLRDQLDQIREIGYALDIREFHNEGICIAAPIFDQSGTLVASITTSGLDSRMENNIDPFALLVIDKANVISKTLGYKG